ncbi:hypothetical protein BGX28_007938 [Mortierella sp. GBA30]|nr:hypothetical protein BGX28_007938 [Mortierella sp. GBA30]
MARPPVCTNNEPPSSMKPFAFPISVSLQDMSENPEWDLENITPPPDSAFYYVLSMKPISLYSLTNRSLLFALRLVLRVAQTGLMACLLLLNTYWCSHVEALVDEGNFMSKTEMYMYWILAAMVLVVPVSVFVGIGYGIQNWETAANVSDLLLLLLGLTIILGYTMTCLRLRALERDSRDVNGEATTTTLQLIYYVYCIYWLIGSMIAILILGILYKFRLVNPGKNPVLAQVVNDTQGALWSTIITLLYPAAMFLLYPSVDVLTKPENDPAAMFQKRDRRTVKDAKRIRESFYVEGDSMHGVESGQPSSFYGLTAHSGLSLRQPEGGQSQATQHQQQHQRHSIYEPKRRERMGSITAAVNEMQLIIEEDGPEPIEVISDVKDPSSIHSPVNDSNVNAAEKPSRVDAKKSSEDSGTLTLYEDDKDLLAMKTGLAQNGDVDRTGSISGLEEVNPPEQHVWNESPTTHTALITTATSDIRTVSSPYSEEHSMKPITHHARSLSATSKTTAGTSTKPSATPLTGILKARNSTSSARTSFGQNAFDQAISGATNDPMPARPAPAISDTCAAAYGARVSSVQSPQHVNVGSRKSTEAMPVQRRASSGSSRPNLATSSSAPALVFDTSSPSSPSQQRRSNVTGRVDAGALALATQQQQHQLSYNHSQRQQEQNPRSSRDGVEVDYFGLRKFSFEDRPRSTPTSPPPLPYEPQAQGIQQLDLPMSPNMTGFLMADPYPSAGTRYLDSGAGDDSEQGFGSSISLTETQEDLSSSSDTYSRRSGSSGGSKKYRAPPPPIPTPAMSTSVHTKSMNDKSAVPTTPTTPTTPPGVRPRRSMDTVMDRQFIEMANRMYDNHVAPPHILQGVVSAGSIPGDPTTSSSAASAFRMDYVMTSISSVPQSSISGMQAGLMQQHQQQQQQPISSAHLGASPPAKSPYRGQESFGTKTLQTDTSISGTGQNAQGGPSVPPSPASTASPTIVPATTLPRPLTPAWYETKTNLASTNDVLSHYNAVMRGGSYHNQQQRQQQQGVQDIADQQYYHQKSIGPLDEVPQIHHPVHTQQLPPIHPMMMLPSVPQPQPLNQQQSQGQLTSMDHSSAQQRMGSADSFGVIRKPSNNRKGEASKSLLSSPHDGDQQPRTSAQHRSQQQEQQQHSSQFDRHSFMMPSETISTYSTWTGDLSDVTNTSGEVSLGAFLDRKQSSTVQSHHRRKSGDNKVLSSSLSTSSHSAGGGGGRANLQYLHSGDERDKDSREIRKSEASAYSMGSSFGVGSSSSRQSVGDYSNYSNNSGFGSGPVIVSASLLPADSHSTVGGDGSDQNVVVSPITSPATATRRQSSGQHKKRTSGSSSGNGQGNTARLSAFASEQEGRHISGDEAAVAGQIITSGHSAFYLQNVDPEMSQGPERMMQQQWMDHRTAVMKDSKSHLEQQHQQHQQRPFQARENRPRQELEEPYSLNSIYFKSSAELLGQLGTQPPASSSLPSDATAALSSVVAQGHPFSRTDSTGMSFSTSPIPAMSPNEYSVISTAGLATAPAVNAVTATSSPSPRPFQASSSSSDPSPALGSDRPYESFSARSSIFLQDQRTGHVNNEGPNKESDEDFNPLIQSSSSYSQHHTQNQRQRQPQQEQQPQALNLSLLHYDSSDSIATLRGIQQQHPSLTSLSSTPQQPPSISTIPSPTSPSLSSSQRLLYEQQQQQQNRQYQQQAHNQQQYHHHNQMYHYPSSPQTRTMTPSMGGGHYEGLSESRRESVATAAASRSMSPEQTRTSSRLTNVTNAESEYQWESAELNHHRWEMMETPKRNQP